MKHIYLDISKHNDLGIVFDDDKKHFALTVATNRLPDAQADCTDLKTMTEYFELLRANLKPIGLPHDGKTMTMHSLQEVQDTINTLTKEGYRIAVDAAVLVSERHATNASAPQPKAKTAAVRRKK